MELEFDKEIDAILRKNARGPTAAGSLKSAHLEADEIAAFAENALPANARSFYTKHLADCDRCRTVLSQTISLYPEAEIDTASSAVLAEAVVPVKSWYRTFFAIPNLAASMGALVVVFAGLFAYLVYQRNYDGRSADVAKLNKSETAANEARPYSEPAASSANAVSNSSNTAANAAPLPTTSGGSPMTKTLGQSDVEQPTVDDDKAPADTGKNERLREEDAPAAEPPAAAAPVMKEQPKDLPLNGRKVAEKKAEDKLDAKSEVTVDGVSQNKPELSKDATIQSNGQILNNQNNVGGAATKSKSGPYRDMQQRNVNPVAGARSDEEAPPTRRAAGRSFAKKDGVWYDSAYRGQPTINIRRGTGEYKILDSGLRSIAESVGGTVVVVWKDKAYRIQ